MRWKRIAILSTLLAALGAVAVMATPIPHRIKSELRGRAEAVPVLASPEETRAILGAVLEQTSFLGI